MKHVLRFQYSENKSTDTFSLTEYRKLKNTDNNFIKINKVQVKR
jgi:hypothetical protein